NTFQNVDAAVSGLTRPTGPAVDILGEVKRQSWQSDAWRMWGCLGEIHFPTSHIARQCSRVEWNVEVDGRPLEPDDAALFMDEITRNMGAREATRLLA